MGGMDLKVKYDEDNKILLLEITEEIDHHIATKIRSRADYEIQKYMPRKVFFDFNNVTFMDSAGIGMLIGRYKMVTMLGGTINMINVKPNIRKIFEMSGVSRLIPILENVKIGGENDG